MPAETVFATDIVATANLSDIDHIRRAAAESPKARARLCLHANLDDQLHNMLIVLRRGTQIPVHRHMHKAECYHVVSGLMSLIVCTEAGEELRRVPLGPPESGRTFLCRIAPGLWHTVEVESDEVVLHESTPGPFRPTDTEYSGTSAGSA